MSNALLQINAYLRAPLAFEIEEPGSSQTTPFPNLGHPRARFDQIFSVPVSNGLHFNVCPFVDEGEWQALGVGGAPVRGVVYFSGDMSNHDQIVRGLEVHLEELVDQLSILWDFPVTAYRLEIIDVTKPITIGDVRKFVNYTNYATPKLQSSDFHTSSAIDWSTLVRYDTLAEPVRAAMRWYRMGLEESADVQRFACFWIALEILVQHGQEAVSLFYKAPCGHEIQSCPVCSKPTSRNVGGQQIINFLAERAGVARNVAKALWKTRQMFHGANRLVASDLTLIPQRLGELWTAVREILVAKTGGKLTAPPAPPIATSAIIMMGTREVKAMDLDESYRTFPPVTRLLQFAEMRRFSPAAGASGIVQNS
ncbi:hypothetical protein QWJ07_06175 [Frankia sp. RB7]|nr:hypothetical protein [Frankia sp. RB7]